MTLQFFFQIFQNRTEAHKRRKHEAHGGEPAHSAEQSTDGFYHSAYRAAAALTAMTGVICKHGGKGKGTHQTQNKQNCKKFLKLLHFVHSLSSATAL